MTLRKAQLSKLAASLDQRRGSLLEEIRDALIGRSCHIGRNASVGAGTVLGDKSTLTDYTRV